MGNALTSMVLVAADPGKLHLPRSIEIIYVLDSVHGNPLH
jgi:hypothetical protein